MGKQRLDKLIASMGEYSRREVKHLIRQGRVKVDGQFPQGSEEKFNPEVVEISIDGSILNYTTFTYIMLCKPAGILSATKDGRGKTVLDLLPKHLQRRGLFPVGRLDKDTEGLLLLTNDGQLAHQLLAPRYHVDKVYYAQVTGRLLSDDQKAFSVGMTLADGLKCRPAELQILSVGENSECLVTLREGKFHQVKRMLAARGHPVTYLKRIQMGNLTLDSQLQPGDYRYLTTEEREKMLQIRHFS